MAPPGTDKAPVFDGRGASFLDFDKQVHQWMRATKTELAARTSLLVLHMQPAPRQVPLAECEDVSGRHNKDTRMLEILRSYFAPEAADAIRQQVMRFMNCRRSDQALLDRDFQNSSRRCALRMRGCSAKRNHWRWREAIRL